MMKSLNGQLFYTIVILIGSILAVLGLIIGQLFPFFANQYLDNQTDAIHQQLEDTIDTDLQLTLSEREQLMQAIIIPEQTLEEGLNKEKQRLGVVLAFLILMAIGVIWLTTSYIVRNLLEPIVNVTNTAKELAVGNYRARAFAEGPSSLVELKNSVNTLAKNLENITKTRAFEEERLKTLVETMGSGLLMMNREGQVTIANRVFTQNFGMSYKDVVGKSFLTLKLPDPLNKFIDHVFLTEQTERKQMSLKFKNEVKHKQVFGAPVVGEHGKWLGVVIVLHDITEVIRLEQVRRDFVANVSHELRTPITSIKGFSETLLDGAYQDKEMLFSFLEIIYKESNRLQMLVNDLLDLSKLESQGYEIDKDDVSVQDVLARVVEVTGQKMDEKNIQFTVENELDVHVLGEENRLIQIFTNLISNAVMYSSENSNVKIAVNKQRNFGVIEVIDEGMGIEEADLARVFERFYRVDTARSRNSGGTGLGLAIVKHLVELHHGEIEVESQVGEGTIMRVRIPLS